jgi:hypothetical protein
METLKITIRELSRGYSAVCKEAHIATFGDDPNETLGRLSALLNQNEEHKFEIDLPPGLKIEDEEAKSNE